MSQVNVRRFHGSEWRLVKGSIKRLIPRGATLMFIQPRIFPFIFFLRQKWRPKNWQRVKDLRFYQKRHLLKMVKFMRKSQISFQLLVTTFGSIGVFVTRPGSYHEPTGDRDPIDRLKEDRDGWWKTRIFSSFKMPNWVVVSNIFYFHPYLWKMNPFWLFFFQRGWNHPLAKKLDVYIVMKGGTNMIFIFLVDI